MRKLRAFVLLLLVAAGVAGAWFYSDWSRFVDAPLAVCEARDQLFGESIATWQTVLTGSSPGFGTFTGDKQYVMASHGEIQSAIRAGVYWRRNLARLLSARLAKIPLRESPMRLIS